MNIIKLKDAIIPDKYSVSEIFNNHLKDRYAYWVQMRYIVPLHFMKHGEYVDCEQDEKKIKKFPHIDMYSMECCMLQFVENYVDSIETDKINSISEYIVKNEQIPDIDITINDLKKFRKWLAETLLNMSISMDDLNPDVKFTEEQSHVLEYYANDMYNDVIKYLTLFANEEATLTDLASSNCDCCNNEVMFQTSPIYTCNSLVIYRKNIYHKMVNMFSNIDFWTKWSDEFITLFKKYIDNIIKVNLKINNKPSYDLNYRDCVCNKENDDQNLNILKRLSIALGYILDKTYKSHKNYVYDALYDWSSMLYEYMQW